MAFWRAHIHSEAPKKAYLQVVHRCLGVLLTFEVDKGAILFRQAPHIGQRSALAEQLGKPVLRDLGVNVADPEGRRGRGLTRAARQVCRQLHPVFSVVSPARTACGTAAGAAVKVTLICEQRWLIIRQY